MSVNSKHARVEIVVDGTDIMVIKAEMKRLKAENKKLKAQTGVDISLKEKLCDVLQWEADDTDDKAIVDTLQEYEDFTNAHLDEWDEYTIGTQKRQIGELTEANEKLKQEMSAERKVFEDMNSQGWLKIATADEERTTLKAENERLNAMVVHLLEKKVVDLCVRASVIEKKKQEADTEWPTFSPQGADDDS